LAEIFVVNLSEEAEEEEMLNEEGLTVECAVVKGFNAKVVEEVVLPNAVVRSAFEEFWADLLDVTVFVESF
jgi:hypothetical protein